MAYGAIIKSESPALTSLFISSWALEIMSSKAFGKFQSAIIRVVAELTSERAKH